jgi:hypothetical protein
MVRIPMAYKYKNMINDDAVHNAGTWMVVGVMLLPNMIFPSQVGGGGWQVYKNVVECSLSNTTDQPPRTHANMGEYEEIALKAAGECGFILHGRVKSEKEGMQYNF